MRFVGLLCLLACGGSSRYAIRPHLASQSWYRSPAACAQGPFELEIPTRGGRWGDQVELRVSTPHAIALQAQVIVDGKPGPTNQDVFGKLGREPGTALDNARCIASAAERAQLEPGGAPGRGDGSDAPASPALGSPAGEPAAAATAIALVAQPAPHGEGTVVALADVPAGAHRVVVRFWSNEPNDLDGVTFSVADLPLAPGVSDAEYDAHERQLAAAERVESRRADDASARRAHFCSTHPDDRDCWGVGGRRVADELARHEQERAVYCTAHPENALCNDEWTFVVRSRERIAAALAPPHTTAQPEPPAKPEGPPPAPLAETMPPKLSLHAEWRPGYWEWAEGKWVWLAGTWRVPDSDIVAEQTTTAPQAPPPPRSEAMPPPPVTIAVWVPGFWQWSGATWVWIPGAWQLRPEAGTTWRAAEWRARGAVHVLIPGRWVRP